MKKIHYDNQNVVSYLTPGFTFLTFAFANNIDFAFVGILFLIKGFRQNKLLDDKSNEA